MSDKLFELEGAPAMLDPRKVEIHEALSTPYEISVLARSPDQSLDLEAIVGKEACFILRSPNHNLSTIERRWRGVCSSITHVRAVEDAGDDVLSTYHLTLAPRLWLLNHGTNQRIFQGKKLPSIVKEVLGEWDVMVDMSRLELARYRDLDHVVQYAETDFNFISRLLERAGISYYFAFDGKEGELTLCDEPHRPASGTPRGIPHNPNQAETGSTDHLSHLAMSDRMVHGRVVIGDHDFRHPQNNLRSYIAPPTKEAGADAPYEEYLYHPGAAQAIEPEATVGTPFADDKGKVRAVIEELKGRAKRRLQAERCRKREISFEANCFDLSPGSVILVEEAPRPELACQQHLVMGFAFTGEVSSAERWHQMGTLVTCSVPFRPIERTLAPVVAGVQSAMVVGEGEEIHTDEYGRVRSQLHWAKERGGEPREAGKTSCWMRVSQAWAGNGYGFITIPRSGHEVLVTHYDGNPDRPVVIGRLHNAKNAVVGENELPRYQTRSSWMSDTSSHRDDSANVIRFEDSAGGEYIYTQAQRDQLTLVKNDAIEHTGDDRALVVGNNRAAVVAGVDAVYVGKKYSIQMITPPGADDLKIMKLGAPEVDPLPTKIELVHGAIMTTVGDASLAMNGGDLIFEVTDTLSIKAGGQLIVVGGPNIHINPILGGGGDPGCLKEAGKAAAPVVRSMAPLEAPVVQPQPAAQPPPVQPLKEMQVKPGPPAEHDMPPENEPAKMPEPASSEAETVENARKLGLETPQKKAEFCEGFRAIKQQWGSLDESQRIEELEALADQALGVPGLSQVVASAERSPGDASFDSGAGTTALSAETLGAAQLSEQDAAGLAVALYHETRHAEQFMAVGQLKAKEYVDLIESVGGFADPADEKLEVMNLLKSDLGFHSGLAEEVVKRYPNQPPQEQVFAEHLNQQWWGDGFAHANKTYDALHSETTIFMAFREAHAHSEQRLEIARSITAKPAELPSWVDAEAMVKQATEVLERASKDLAVADKRYNQAHKAYTDLHAEADARRTETGLPCGNQ